jgi:hypothetical protein
MLTGEAFISTLYCHMWLQQQSGDLIGSIENIRPLHSFTQLICYLDLK